MTSPLACRTNAESQLTRSTNPVKSDLDAAAENHACCISITTRAVFIRTLLAARVEELAHLSPMPQRGIRQHTGHHRFAHRHGADADARIVAAFGDDLGFG